MLELSSNMFHVFVCTTPRFVCACNTCGVCMYIYAHGMSHIYEHTTCKMRHDDTYRPIVLSSLLAIHNANTLLLAPRPHRPYSVTMLDGSRVLR